MKRRWRWRLPALPLLGPVGQLESRAASTLAVERSASYKTSAEEGRAFRSSQLHGESAWLKSQAQINLWYTHRKNKTRGHCGILCSELRNPDRYGDSSTNNCREVGDTSFMSGARAAVYAEQKLRACSTSS